MIVNYFIMSVIAVILAFIFRKDYHKGLCVSIFLLILLPKNLCIELGGQFPAFTIHRMIILILLIKWSNNKTIKKNITTIPFIVPFSLLLFMMSISASFSSNILVSMKRLMFFSIESFLYFIVLQTSLRNLSDIRNVIKYILYSLIAVAILGFIQKVTGFNPMQFFGSRGGEFIWSSKDINSTYPHRILLGVAMATGLIYSQYQPQVTSFFRQKGTYIAKTFIFGSMLYFSLSRGPWLAAICGFCFLMIHYSKIYYKRLLFIVCLTMLTFIIKPGTKDTIFVLFESTTDSTTLKGSSFQWRFAVINKAISEIKSAKSILKFFFGFGQGNHVLNSFGFVETSRHAFLEMESWDCEYAIILYELGIMGFISYMLFHGSVFIRSFTWSYRLPEARILFGIVLANIVVFEFMKLNVSLFSEQLQYNEYANIAFASYLLSGRKKVLKYP